MGGEGGKGVSHSREGGRGDPSHQAVVWGRGIDGEGIREDKGSGRTGAVGELFHVGGNRPRFAKTSGVRMVGESEPADLRVEAVSSVCVGGWNQRLVEKYQVFDGKKENHK